jgi:lipopolysaccharide/colanic/teichoic acid biosynthesis glycosyltransferase
MLTSKILFDRAFSVMLLVVLSPLVLLLFVLVRVFLGAPVLFTQRRPGVGGRSFRLVKFRTMTDETDECGCLLADEERLTGLGRFLRQSSLDELPTLWNVVKGDMSLVGPRPLLMEYLPLYSAEQARRHEVLPGITGWAQINGRNAISWEEKFDLDVWYVDNRTFWLDMVILFLTVKKVVIREGISAEGHVTMPVFRKSDRE